MKQVLTFVIPVRIDSAFRLRNLKTVINYFSAKSSCVKFIITEGDIVSRIESIPESEKVRKIFTYDENPIFHRTKYVNDILRTIDNNIVAIWDADAIGNLDNVFRAANILMDSNAVMIYPYNGIFWSVGKYYSEFFAIRLDLDVLTTYRQPMSLMCGYHSVGGAFLINVKRYKKYGWENENFKGWGPEDAERFARLEILGKKPLRINAELYHLYHPRGVNSGSFDRELALSTKREYAKVCGMTPNELNEYIATWSWIK